MHLSRKETEKIVEFDDSKIAKAIYMAAQSVGGSDKELAKALADKVKRVNWFQHQRIQSRP